MELASDTKLLRSVFKYWLHRRIQIVLDKLDERVNSRYLGEVVLALTNAHEERFQEASVFMHQLIVGIAAELSQYQEPETYLDALVHTYRGRYEQ